MEWKLNLELAMWLEFMSEKSKAQRLSVFVRTLSQTTVEPEIEL